MDGMLKQLADVRIRSAAGLRRMSSSGDTPAVGLAPIASAVVQRAVERAHQVQVCKNQCLMLSTCLRSAFVSKSSLHTVNSQQSLSLNDYAGYGSKMACSPDGQHLSAVIIGRLMKAHIHVLRPPGT